MFNMLKLLEVIWFLISVKDGPFTWCWRQLVISSYLQNLLDDPNDYQKVLSQNKCVHAYETEIWQILNGVWREGDSERTPTQ